MRSLPNHPVSKYYFLSLFCISLFFLLFLDLLIFFLFLSPLIILLIWNWKIFFFLNKVLGAINRQNEEGREHLRVIAIDTWFIDYLLYTKYYPKVFTIWRLKSILCEKWRLKSKNHLECIRNASVQVSQSSIGIWAPKPLNIFIPISLTVFIKIKEKYISYQ